LLAEGESQLSGNFILGYDLFKTKFAGISPARHPESGVAA